jgi:uncharacterized membrane protein HdeD (DUF308 family)
MSAIPVPIMVKGSQGWSIALSTLMVVAGILSIAVPLAAAVAVNLLVGWLLVFSGGAHLVFAWQTRHTGGFLWEVILGMVYGATGVYLLASPLLGLISLALALAVYLWAEAILEFLLAYYVRTAPGSGWLLFDGIVTAILAFMIWRLWPSGAAWAIGTLVGISMIFSGVSRLMISLAARRLAIRAA